MQPQISPRAEWWRKTAQSVGIVAVAAIVLLLLYSCSVQVKVDVKDPKTGQTTHDLYSHLDTTDLAAEFALLFPEVTA